MFGIKRRIKNNFLSTLRFWLGKTLTPDYFPQEPVFPLFIKLRLWLLKGELKKIKSKTDKFFSHLAPYPAPIAIDVWRQFLLYNPNNLGNWSISSLPKKQLFGTRVFEKEVIWKMIDLYGGRKENLEGYITSGGTEGNIFSAWVGRNYLEKEGVDKEKICLVKTSLTHYSIEKASDIVGIPTFITPLNSKNWGMDIDCFAKTIQSLHKRGFRGFLLPLTLGYTVTGTADPYLEICLKIREIKKKIKNIKFFVWLDAALNGLIEPFLNSRFSPFALPEVQTVLTDFHKLGLAPYPAGIILYRTQLRSLIEKNIPYLAEKDNTLLGSRPGISAVACWSAIETIGKSGAKELIEKNLAKKKRWVTSVRKTQKATIKRIISPPRSLTVALILKQKTITDWNISKMRLVFERKIKTYRIATFFFLWTN